MFKPGRERERERERERRKIPLVGWCLMLICSERKELLDDG
jgi:hypothetical protein